MLIKGILNRVKKTDLIDEIKTEVAFSYQYFSLLILSVVIATFGLLLGNTAIIIGAMILSPLIWPIIGLSIGVVTSRNKITIQSGLLLLTSIVITVIIAFFITYISPIADLNSEILLRGNPTFFDLIIALAAGIAAVLIMSWPRYSNQLAGVAVAASVLPPICVTGIVLAMGSLKMAYGSFVLFLTNTSSIIFVGLGIFALFGFYKKSDEDQVKKVEFGLIASFVVVLLLSFQLIFSLSQILYEENTSVIIEETLTKKLEEISSDIRIDSVKVSAISRTSNTIDVDAILRVPSDTQLTVTDKNKIVESISQTLQKEINLELRIVPILTVVTDLAETDGDLVEESVEEQRIKVAQRIFTDAIESVSDDIIIETASVSQSDLAGVKRYKLDALVRVPPDFDFEPSIKEEIMTRMVAVLEKPVVMNVRLVRYEEL